MRQVLLFVLLSFFAISFAQKPQMKVDISITGRSDDETLEPGYNVWRPGQGASTDTYEKDGIKFTFSVPSGSTYQCRTGWSKSYIQNAEYKAQNGRLTFDGLTLDPATGCGELNLTIEGLPKGTHTLQTYHNRWENPSNFNGWPISVKVNGEQVYSKVQTTFLQSVAPNACMLTFTLNVANDGDKVVVSFYTLDDEGPADQSKSGNNKAPIINGFELNTTNVKAQAKDPDPTSGNIHLDADNGDCTLRWSPASKSVVKHILYMSSDSTSVAQMSAPTAELTDTTYQLHDLYSMNTYYWRVDEVDASGTTTQGNVWYFRPRQLAFPGAEGYGRFAQGGRGGVVYHVTNLKNDTIPGSFIYGLIGLTGPRTIVFDVSGIITMSANPTEDMPSVFSNPYVTIAGQTAPGKGICLRYCNIGITAESIVRHMRFKRGLGAYGVTGNAVGMNNNYTMMDHCTAAWGTDETLSTRGAKNITFQYSMIAEALGITGHKNYSWGSNHGFAATIDGNTGTYSHNMLVNCAGRNWSMGGGMDGTNTPIGHMDIFNNVCYNWNGRTTDGGCHEVNFVNNYYKMGPDTKRTELFIQQYESGVSPQGTQQAYISGNIRENKDHSLTTDKYGDTYTYTVDTSKGATDPNTRTENHYNTFVDKPFFESYATIHSAKDAFKIVTSTSGATMPCRDNQHKRVMNEAINGTYTYTGSLSKIKGEIDTEADITGEANSGWEEWPEEHRAADFDTDQDGMPDWWEKVVGSDPAVANNNDDPDHDGWTLLEDYINFMAHPYVVVAPGESATFDCAQEFCGFTKSPQFSVSTDSKLFSASVSGSTITVKASTAGGIGTVNMTVKDGDGTEYTQPLGVAVTGDPTTINTITADENNTPVKREFFTLDGKKVSRLTPHEVYIKKDTDTTGHIHTVKILKN